MLLEIPLDEDERAAVEGGVEAMDALIAKRRNVATPDGRTPAQIKAAALASSFIPITDLAS
jgi:hypothetical protein